MKESIDNSGTRGLDDDRHAQRQWSSNGTACAGMYVQLLRCCQVYIKYQLCKLASLECMRIANASPPTGTHAHERTGNIEQKTMADNFQNVYTSKLSTLKSVLAESPRAGSHSSRQVVWLDDAHFPHADSQPTQSEPEPNMPPSFDRNLCGRLYGDISFASRSQSTVSPDNCSQDPFRAAHCT